MPVLSAILPKSDIGDISSSRGRNRISGVCAGAETLAPNRASGRRGQVCLADNWTAQRAAVWARSLVRLTRPAPSLARDASSVGSRQLPVFLLAAEVTCPLTPPPLTAVNGANWLWLASIVSRHLTRWHEPDEYRPL